MLVSRQESLKVLKVQEGGMMKVASCKIGSQHLLLVSLLLLLHLGYLATQPATPGNPFGSFKRPFLFEMFPDSSKKI